jgi:hypothetical protein
MWLVLTDPGDHTGAWLGEGLRKRGLEPLEVLAVDELLTDTKWVHTIGETGARFTAELPGGRLITSDDVRGVVNRISYVSPSAAAVMDPTDREYVNLEQHAFLLSWLHAIQAPVLNPPSPRGLGGAWRHASEWFWLATQAGLACEPFRSSSADPAALWASLEPWSGLTAITVGTQIVDNGLPEDLKQGCVNLAHLSATPLLSVHFRSDNGRVLFAGANPRPQIEHAGDAALDALAYVFGKRVAA